MSDIQLSGFEIIAKLAGETAVCSYKAHQVNLDRMVVIKVIGAEIASDPTRLDALLKEARRGARLKHPGILQVFDAGVDGDRHYLVMEWPAGSNVDQLLRSLGALPQEKALRIVRAMADALEFAWVRASLVHGMLAPDLIFLDDGVVKVAGLGLSGLYAAEYAEMYGTTPSPYSPPEHAPGVKPSTRGDMFAAGMLLAQMLTGKIPSFGDLAGPPPEGVPLSVWQPVQALTARDPEQRIAKWTDLQRMIDKILAEKTGPVPAEAGRPIAAVAPVKKPSAGGARVAAEGKAPVVLRSPRKELTGASSGELEKIVNQYTPGNQHPVQSLILWFLTFSVWGLLAFVLLRTPAVPALVAIRDPAALPRGGVVATVGTTPAKDVPPEPGATRIGPSETPPVAQPRLSEKDLAARNARRLNELEDEMAQYLTREEYELAVGAAEVVLEDDQWKGIGGPVRALQAFAGQVGKLNEEVGNALRDRIGEEVAVTFQGKPVKGILQSARDGQVELLQTVDQQGVIARRSYSISIADLTPVERARLLGERKTPVRNAMRFILCVRSRASAETTRRLAEDCGPLTAAFQRLAQAKIN